MKFTEFSSALELGKYANRKIVISNARFQIPRLYMPFGISGFAPTDGSQRKWNIDFALKGWEEDGNYTQKFYRFLVDLDNQVIDYVHANSLAIFGAQLSRDALAAMFMSNIKESQGGYEPKFRVKVDVDSNNFIKPKIFDVNEEDITSEVEDKLHSRHTGAAIIELDSVWFMNKRFGLTWKMQQLKVFPLRSETLGHAMERAQAHDGGGGGLKGFQFVV